MSPSGEKLALAANGSHRVGVELMGKTERRLTPPRFAEALLALARAAARGGQTEDETPSLFDGMEGPR